MSFAVTDDRLEQALRAIAQTDQEIGVAKYNVLRTEFMAKCSESLAYKSMDSTLSIEERKRMVPIAQGVKDEHEKHWNAVCHYETLRAKREREYMVIELYRTASANQRRGNV